MLEHAFRINFGGKLPKIVVEKFLIPGSFIPSKKMQTDFIMSIKLDDLLKEDGKMLGEVAVNQIRAAKKRGGWKKQGELGMQGVDEFLYISVAMRELLIERPWLREMVRTLVQNSVAPSRTVRKVLAEMTEQDATVLAKGLITIILSNTLPESSVDHWFNQNPILGEFEAAYPWSRPFFVEIAQYNLNTSNLGVVMRVSVGAVLSTVDLVSDVIVTYRFLITPALVGYGHMNVTLIGLTMGTQVVLAYAQHSSKLSLFLKESAIVLLGLKPAWDAYLIGTGAEKKEHSKFDPFMEMSFCKCIETIFEAIPASILQMYVILSSGNFDNIAIASILVSAATTAFTSTMLTFDWDTSPTKRAQGNKNVKFYGFVPDGAAARVTCFASMFSFTFAHTLARAFSCALLAAVNKRWLMCWLTGDMLVYFLYKFARGDLRYGTNASDGLSATFSTIARFGEKVLVDNTALMQVRHPGQIGGLFWTASLIMSQISCFVCGWLYLMNYKNKEGEKETKLSENVVWGSIGLLFALFVVGWIVFLLVMNREFLDTFFSTDTYASYLKKWFAGIPDSDDEMKSTIFSKHPSHRKKMEGEIKAWTLANWERWDKEKPKFFTDAWIDSVPNDCIPFKFCVQYKKTKGRREKRRASVSIKEMLGGEAEVR
jgi:hypothetical protein